MKKVIIIFMFMLAIIYTKVNAVSYKLIDDKYYMKNGMHMLRIMIDGKLAFCLEPGISAGTSGYYKQDFLNNYNKLSLSKKKQIQYIGLYTQHYFKLKNNISYYYAGQEIIWDIVSSKSYRFKQDLTNYRNTLLSAAKSFESNTIYNNKMFEIKAGQSKVLQNESLRNFSLVNQKEFESKTGLNVSLVGDKLTIINPLFNTKVTNEKLQLKKFTSMFTSGTSIAHYHKTLQNYVNINNSTNILSTINFTTKKSQGSFSGKKVDENNHGIKNVKFAFYKNNLQIGVLTTDENGVFQSGLIDIGNYQVREIEVNEQYELDDRIYNISIEDNKNTLINNGNNIVNKFKRGKIKIIKHKETLAESRAMENVVFGVYKDNNLIEKLTTNSNGEAISSELIYGVYYVKELETDSFYELDKKLYEVDIKKQGVTVINNGNPILNQYKRGSFKALKVNEKSTGLKGVVFSLMDINRKEISKIISNEYGEIYFNNLIYGKYFLKEVKTVDGYNLLENEIEINIDKELVILDNIVNIEKKYKLIIEKLDKLTNLPLSNTIFKITNNNTEIISKTNDLGKIELELKKGCYKIEEVQAKKGYILKNDITNICFDKKDSIIKKYYNVSLINVETGVKKSKNWIFLTLVTIGTIAYFLEKIDKIGLKRPILLLKNLFFGIIGKNNK